MTDSLAKIALIRWVGCGSPPAILKSGGIVTQATPSEYLMKPDEMQMLVAQGLATLNGTRYSVTDTGRKLAIAVKVCSRRSRLQVAKGDVMQRVIPGEDGKAVTVQVGEVTAVTDTTFELTIQPPLQNGLPVFGKPRRVRFDILDGRDCMGYGTYATHELVLSASPDARAG